MRAWYPISQPRSGHRLSPPNMTDAHAHKTPVDAWWLQYPTVKSIPERRDPAYLEGLMTSSDKSSGKDFAVIDVRGTDRVVSLSIPPNLNEPLVTLLHSIGRPRQIFISLPSPGFLPSNPIFWRTVQAGFRSHFLLWKFEWSGATNRRMVSHPIL